MKDKKMLKSILLYGFIFVFIVLLLGMRGLPNSTNSSVAAEPYTYTDLVQDLESGAVSSLDVQVSTDVSNYGTATVTHEDGSISTIHIPSMDRFMDIVNYSAIYNGTEIETPDISKSGILMSILPSLGLMILAIVAFSFMFQKMQGGGKMASFGKSKAKVNVDEDSKVNFSMVAGLDEEKEELKEIVEFLRDPNKYSALGARIPKGVLLVGPPGTGKTLLAKAVAGEAKVPFFSISGSDFVEMFVGVGASRVRDLFDQAKKNSPCIIFIDEIDAVGRRRGAGLGGGHDEREQTLNQLLVEMDGFGVNEGVIVLAATNRADILDPAILRPGRFDRQVYIGRPDVKGREAILKVHAKGKPFAEDVDLSVVAKTTAGFTGADLENLLNESALMTARDGKKQIDMEEIQKAFIKIGVGTEKKNRVIKPKEKLVTAYHEAGHAILFEVLSELDPVHSISIIPTGFAGGYTMPLPGEDKMYATKKSMEQEIVSLLGGRAAEFIVLKDVTTGASNDIERATAIARNMVTKYGMSDILGPVQFGDSNDELFLGKEIAHSRNYGENIATVIDQEVKRIVETAYEEAKRLLMENIDILHAAAKYLVDNEKMTGDEFRKLFVKEKPELIESECAGVIEEAFGTVEANETNKLEEALGTVDEASNETKVVEVKKDDEIHDDLIHEVLDQIEKDGVIKKQDEIHEDDMK